MQIYYSIIEFSFFGRNYMNPYVLSLLMRFFASFLIMLMAIDGPMPSSYQEHMRKKY